MFGRCKNPGRGSILQDENDCANTLNNMDEQDHWQYCVFCLNNDEGSAKTRADAKQKPENPSAVSESALNADQACAPPTGSFLVAHGLFGACVFVAFDVIRTNHNAA